MLMKKIVFSGIQPTGDVHLGNYAGAVAQWVALQNEQYNNIYCIVDMHAITTFQAPSALRENTLKMLAFLIAAGIDYKKSTLFVQSQNPHHAELAWIMNCVARMGWLKRMTQFKEKAGKHQEESSTGLFVYPNLQSADILLYGTNIVPVGEDQKQHIELCRDSAQKFNNDYNSDCLVIPEHMTLPETGRIMSLQDGTKKMSKSDPADNAKLLFSDSDEAITRKIMRAKTDSLPMPASLDEAKARVEVYNLLNILAFCTKKPVVELINTWQGKGFKEFKETLAEQLVLLISPIRSKQQELLNDKNTLELIMRQGAEKAVELSAQRIKKIKEAIGFINI
jgi:tryptophanyl-tRNA synthetase